MRALRLLGALGLALGATLAAPALPTTLSASVPLVGAAPAAAAGCEFSNGVTVVIDYNQLRGGDLVQGCVADGGGDLAYDLFEATGADQTGTREFPGFICRVNGVPAADPCRTASPADAYWSLWWTDGNGGDWIYSSLGVKSLRVPDGGYVAWSWQGQNAKAPPSTAPTRRPSPPSSGGAGSQNGSGGSGGSDSQNGSGGSGGSGGQDGSGGSSGPGGGASAPGGDPSGTPSASDDPSGEADPPGGQRRGGAGRGATAGEGGPGKDGRKATGGKAERPGRSGGPEDEADESVSSPLTDADGDVEDVSSASEEDPAGLPGWVPFLVIGVLGAGGLGAVLLRRRTSGGA